MATRCLGYAPGPGRSARVAVRRIRAVVRRARDRDRCLAAPDEQRARAIAQERTFGTNPLVRWRLVEQTCFPTDDYAVTRGVLRVGHDPGACASDEGSLRCSPPR